MTRIEKISDYLRDFATFVHGVKNVIVLPLHKEYYKAPTYYPEKKRKSSFRILLEQYKHILKYGKACELYFFYGFDVVDKSKDDYATSYRKFMKERDTMNLFAKNNSSCILRNKFYFGTFATALGIPTPTNIALYKKGHITNMLQGGGRM